MKSFLQRNGSRIATRLIRFLPMSRAHAVKAWLLRTLGGIQIGRNCEIASTARFVGRHISIGDFCYIGPDVLISGPAEQGRVTIGSNCVLGMQVMVITGSHHLGPPSRRSGKGYFKPITIHDGCRISTRSLLIEGVTIGAGSVVAAGAVVIRDVEPNTLVAGVPAVLKKQLPADPR
jgi:maltose O-acetyltransferase